MKLTSVTIVTFAACGGSVRSSLRAAYRPPNPPPRITTFQAMRRDYSWASRSRLLAADELGEACGGHVSAADRHADAQAAHVTHTAGQQCGERARAGRLGDGLEPLEQEPHRIDDLGVRGQLDRVDALADDRERQLAGRRKLLPV